MLYLACYKHKKRVRSWATFIAWLTDAATRIVTRGQYSHCELAILSGDGYYDCYSASSRDNGVRHKVMRLPKHKWDLFPIEFDSVQLNAYYQQTQHQRYDFHGALGLFLPITQRRKRSFCSEWCWQAIGGSDGWRFSPTDLALIAQQISTNRGKQHERETQRD